MSKDIKLIDQIQAILGFEEDRQRKAERLAEVIRLFCDYRWVGIHEVDETEIAAIAWSGQGAPAFPRFPVTKGLSGNLPQMQFHCLVGHLKMPFLTTFCSS